MSALAPGRVAALGLQLKPLIAFSFVLWPAQGRVDQVRASAGSTLKGARFAASWPATNMAAKYTAVVSP